MAIKSAAVRKVLLSHRRPRTFLVAGMSLVLSAAATADTFTYTNLATASDAWDGGTNWSAQPVSDPTTTLIFGGAGGAGTLGDGVTIVSNNDIAGSFTLNQLLATYTGPGANLVAPTVSITGNPLLFVDDGATTPVLSVTTNRAASNATNQKPSISIANDVIIGSSAFTFSAASNAAGGPTSLVLTGGLSFNAAGPHTLTFGGNLGSGSLGAAINDHSPGDATSVVKDDTGSWVLNGANGYTGGTTINAGSLQAAQSNGFGTGAVHVAAGGQAYAAGAVYDNDFFLNGTAQATGALRLALTTEITGTITVESDARISNSVPSGPQEAVISGQITGSGGVTFGSNNAGDDGLIGLSNTANDYAGDTRLNTTGTSSGSMALRLNADEVLPHGVGKGNLILDNNGAGGKTISVSLLGHNETINGLEAEYKQNAVATLDSRNQVRNGSASTESTLTVGANDASATFVGQLQNGGAANLNLVKIGAGMQTFAGRNTFTGTTTVSAGGIVIDFDQFAPTETSDASDYFSTASDVYMDGGTTLSIVGRTDGEAVFESGVSLPQYSESITVSPETAAALAVGQALTFTKTSGSGTPSTARFVVNITGTTVNLNGRPGGPAVVDLSTSATTATTSQTLKSLNLIGDVGSNVTVDLGTSDNVTLTIDAISQTNDGSTLTIANWSGTPDTGGGTERLMFAGEVTDFTSIFDQSEVIFTGYGFGYTTIDGDGVYEVAAVSVPEPATMSVLTLAGLALLKRRRR